MIEFHIGTLYKPRKGAMTMKDRPASTKVQPAAVTDKMRAGYSQHKAIAMQGIPAPVRRKK